MTTVVIHTDNPQTHVDLLSARHRDLTFVPCNSYDALPQCLRDTRPDIMFSTRFAGTPTYPTQAVLGPDGPRWLSVGGSGVDHLGQWDTNKVVVTNAAGVAASMMAEFAFGCLLHFTLDIDGLNADKSAHIWRDRTVIPLRGKTLLVVGLGQTGQAVAALAQGFGMTVIGTRVRPQPMDNVDQVYAADKINSLLPLADAIVVCTPLLNSTKGLLDTAAFDAMKTGAMLVDVSRGGVVVQSALINALTQGKLAAAGLDVFETEPLPENSPLWDLPNLIVSPHCSSVYEGWEDASILMFSDNIVRFQQGAPLHNVVDPQRGY